MTPQRRPIVNTATTSTGGASTPSASDLDSARGWLSAEFDEPIDGPLLRLRPRSDASARDIVRGMVYALSGAVDGTILLPGVTSSVAAAIDRRMYRPVVLESESPAEAMARVREEMALPGLLALLDDWEDNWEDAVALARRLQ